MAFIELKNVSKQVKKQQLLDNISMSIDKGDIATLEGINGSGKTVLLKAILSLIHVTGTISVNNKQVTMDGRYPIKAGILIENPCLIENITAFQNLDLLSKLQNNISDEQINDLLTDLNLQHTKKIKVKHFSLGMKQKLGIAQAFLGENPLIILDEPTNALDAESIVHLALLIKKLNKKGTTFIIASHDAAFIKQVSTHPFMVKEGNVYEGSKT